MKCFNDYVVNVKVLKDNANNIKDKIGKDKKFCAVVKANAYGVGLQTVCKALTGIADFFACACVKEALCIRTFDKTTPIIILGYIDNCDFKIASNNNISISIGSLEQIKELDSLAKEKIKIHLQVNTGLNRFGFRSISNFKQALKIIENNENIILEGVYTHLATKQNDIAFMNKQLYQFLQYKNFIKEKNVLFHIANSYGIINSNKFHLDMVRAGFLLYGYTENSIGNKPVVSIKSHIISIHSVKKGDTIGYDRTYKCKSATRIAVVPIGYADGFCRRLSNNFDIIINNKKYPIVGRICMDVFMVDVGKDDISVGSSVILLGESKGNKITLNDYAEKIGTSPYEVICNFNYKSMNYIINNK